MKRTLLLALPLALAGCGGSSSHGPQPITVHMTFPVDAGSEKTQCLVTKLHNKEAFDYVHAFSQMTSGSHHLILYRDASALAGQTPPPEGLGDCQMDAARLFLYGAQEPTHDEAMPDGVASELDPDTTLILEAHYVNASPNAVTADVTVTLEPAVPGTIHDYAGIIFYMDDAFSIPAGAGFGSPAYTHSTTCSVPEGLNIFRMTSHGHKRLTDFQIYSEDLSGGTDAGKLYESTNWHEPVEETWPDASPLVTSANQGFRFQCTWNNESSNTIGYGPSVEDEMCIMGAGYYPRVEGPEQLGGNLFCLDGTLYY
jgi:hypothetical protein